MIQATIPRQSAQPLDLNALARQALQPWTDAYDNWRTGVADLVRPAPKPKAGCGCCPTCEADPCTCRCCVANADLVIEARVGERRIIPVTIENHWRRERPIELELSSWTTPDPNFPVTAELLTPAAFTLAPCGEAHVVIVVHVAAAGTTTTPGPVGTAPGPGNTVNAPAPPVLQALPDVDRCVVSYADLRIKGCDLRSIRIAVAALPRDCDAYTVDCDCSCCC